MPSNPSSPSSPCLSSIVVYGGVDTAAQCLLTLVPDPQGCPVLCLKHCSQRLFAGLQSGTVVVFARSSSGEFPPDPGPGPCRLVLPAVLVFRLKPALQILLTFTSGDFHAILAACSHASSVCCLSRGTQAVDVDRDASGFLGPLLGMNNEATCVLNRFRNR